MTKIEVGQCRDCAFWRGNPDHNDGMMVCTLTGSKFPIMRKGLQEALIELDILKNPGGAELSQKIEDLAHYADMLPINIETASLAYCEAPDTFLATSPFFGCVMWKMDSATEQEGRVNRK